MKWKLFCVMLATLILASCNSIRETGVSSDGAVRQISVPVIGEVEVPSEPERVVLMRAMDAGNASLFDAEVVGVNESLKGSEYIDTDSFQDVTYLEYGDIEGIRELDPDLIVTFSGDEYFEDYADIAPAIPLNYQTDALNKFRERIYLNQLLFLGVILNHEDEAEEMGFQWIDDLTSYRREMNTDTSQLDALVLVQSESETGFHVYGPHQSYATEVVYDVLDFNISDTAEDLILDGPVEEYSADTFDTVETDYVFISVRDSQNNEMLKSQFADLLEVNESHVILLEFDNYVANDLQSIEKQTENIIDMIE